MPIRLYELILSYIFCILFQLSLWVDSEDAVSHSQPAFKYQHKCYQRLRQCYEALGSSDKERINRSVSSFF